MNLRKKAHVVTILLVPSRSSLKNDQSPGTVEMIHRLLAWLKVASNEGVFEER